ncbi:GNAT family N-acetyltransferase [Flavobacterium aquicola]|uniref:Acetyltransferase (GNAT) family protein n=1 Tax=Flavobacterium aquicola TaxID=1682742 RepID=A0A3E0EMI4_9FLAO|nr:GNAT family N-acetyltransferase [Flavobacterium aquicola]REG98960.1 acetyltransferase (GNAT) family protein [Flavobacterium aquicola]
MRLSELTTVAEMLAQIETMKHLYPKMTLEKYEFHLKEMVPHNYKQVAVFDGEVCVGLSGFWTAVKLWTGKYIEIDNFIVHSDYRSKGIGKMMTDYIDTKAKAEGCNAVVLDAFTGNFIAHRFYYNQGFEPRGFHFVKMLNEEGLT